MCSGIQSPWRRAGLLTPQEMKELDFLLYADQRNGQDRGPRAIGGRPGLLRFSILHHPQPRVLNPWRFWGGVGDRTPRQSLTQPPAPDFLTRRPPPSKAQR